MQTITNQEAITIALIVFLILLIPVILFLVTQQNTLKAVSAQNRLMAPGQVWLQLIPLFGLIWQFVVVSKIADSIERELAAGNNTFSFEQPGTGYSAEARPTFGVGMAFCILDCCSLIPVIGGLAGLAALVCWIVYWVKLSNYKSQLKALQYDRTGVSTVQ